MSKDLEDNIYPIYYLESDTDIVEEGSMTVKSGKVVETALWDSIVDTALPRSIDADLPSAGTNIGRGWSYPDRGA